MITHYTLQFKGSFNHTFKFDARFNDEDIYYQSGGETHTDLEKFIYFKDDYLYIQGYRITKNENGIRAIQSGLTDGNVGRVTGESFVKSVYAIDNTGNVVCVKHTYSGNKIDFFLSKLLG